MSRTDETADHFFEVYCLDTLVDRVYAEDPLVPIEKTIEHLREIAIKLRKAILKLPTGKQRLEFARQIEFRCKLCGGIPAPIENVTRVVLEEYSNPEHLASQPFNPIRWLKTQRDFVYFLKELKKKKYVDGKTIWKDASQHFCKKDGTEFKPGTLASEAQKMTSEQSWPRGASEIDQMFQDIGDPRPGEG